MSVKKAASDLVQSDLFPLDAARAKARRDHTAGRRRPLCADCGVDTFAIGEWYMVKDEVWDAAGGLSGYLDCFFLCIECLEHRLGRRLTPNDFTDAPVNKSVGKSRRLCDRKVQTSARSSLLSRGRRSDEHKPNLRCHLRR